MKSNAKYSVVIIDDNPLDIEHLTNLLTGMEDNWEVIQQFTDPAIAIEYLLDNKPDLLLVDMEMGVMNGIDFATATLMHNIPLVFVTNYEDMALKAFELSAVDYLIKPVNKIRLTIALEKVKQYNRGNSAMQINLLQEIMESYRTSSSKFGRMIINNQQTVEVLYIDDIVWCEAKGPYTIIVKSDGKQAMATKPLKYYESLLESHGFYRLHRSYMINLRQVQTIDKADLVAKLHSGETLPINPDRLSKLIFEFKNALEAHSDQNKRSR